MKVKIILYILPLLLLCIAIMGCNNARTNVGVDAGGTYTDSSAMANQYERNADTTGMNNSPDSYRSEIDALELLNAINENEINVAAEARSKNISQPVKAYADMLHQEHTNNYNETRELARSRGMNLADNNISTDLKVEGDTKLDKLRVLEGEDFEKAFLDAMIADHANALNLIDNKLMAAATNEAVRQHLTNTRGHIAKHLEEAKKLAGNQ